MPFSAIPTYGVLSYSYNSYMQQGCTLWSCSKIKKFHHSDLEEYFGHISESEMKNLITFKCPFASASVEQWHFFVTASAFQEWETLFCICAIWRGVFRSKFLCICWVALFFHMQYKELYNVHGSFVAAQWSVDCILDSFNKARVYLFT